MRLLPFRVVVRRFLQHGTIQVDFSPQQDSRHKSQLRSRVVDFDATAVGHFVQQAQKGGLVRLQSHVVGALMANVAHEEGSVRQQADGEALAKLHGAVLKAQCRRRRRCHIVRIMRWKLVEQ